MAKNTKTEWWDTTTLCKVFNIDGAMSMLVPTEGIPGTKGGRQMGTGMLGRKHTEETKKKMSASAPRSRPHLHKGGTVISPEGETVYYSTLSHFCKEHGLSSGHVSEMMNGKRRSVKGWVKA